MNRQINHIHFMSNQMPRQGRNIAEDSSEMWLGTEKIPWISIIILTIIFFFSLHDFFYSLRDSFHPSVELSLQAASEGSLKRRIGFFLIGYFGFIGLMRRPANLFKINGSLGWLILFFGTWALLSISWADDIALTFRKLIILGLFFIGALSVNKHFTIRDIFWFMFFSSFIYILIGLTAELALGTFHPLTTDYRFTGTLHSNRQGINCALLLFSSVYFALTTKQGRKYFIICALIGFVFLVLTKSRTPFASIIFVLLFYVILTRPRKLKSLKFALICGMVFTFCLFLLLFGQGFSSTIKKGILLGRVDPANTVTLTHRVPVWKDLLPYAIKRPVRGYGYNGFWTPSRISEISFVQEQGLSGDQAVSGSCSAYYEVILGLGFVGGAIFVFMLLLGIRRCYVHYKLSFNIAYAFFGVLLLFCVLNGLLYATIVRPSFLIFLMWVILIRLGFHHRLYVKKVRT